MRRYVSKNRNENSGQNETGEENERAEESGRIRAKEREREGRGREERVSSGESSAAERVFIIRKERTKEPTDRVCL